MSAHTTPPEGLPAAFATHWRARGFPAAGAQVTVACSGGVDSLVLLHLLRFSAADLGVQLKVAHFDHRMRSGSDDDATWVQGLATAWDLPFVGGAASRSPKDEADARDLRYAFLEGIIACGEAEAVLTAHHADDQVETVLFRALRGTGVTGLEGIPERRPPGIVRPLLPYSRAELEAYAAHHHLRPRVDPTNGSLAFARNRVRLRLLPLLEEVHPGARGGLLRLARNASRAGEALEALLTPLRVDVEVARGERAIELDRNRLLAFPPSVRPELLRSLARSVGIRLSESGTGLADEFITAAKPGGRLDLGGGTRIERSGGRFRLTGAPPRVEPAGVE
jgi:tRNA(Ile)-lysidine synthase